MNIKKHAKGLSEGPRARLSPALLAWAVLAVVTAASSALAQAEKPAPGPSPLEDTWNYLIELFRMVLGI